MRTQQAAVETQRRSLELLLMRHAVGVASLADVDAAQARLAAAEASLPGIRARERAAGFALAVLPGAPPEYGLQLLQGAPGMPALAAIPVVERAVNTDQRRVGIERGCPCSSRCSP